MRIRHILQVKVLVFTVVSAADGSSFAPPQRPRQQFPNSPNSPKPRQQANTRQKPYSLPRQTDPRNPNGNPSPIHYNFPATATGDKQSTDEKVPKQFTSARQDAITRFQSTSRGHYLLLLSSCTLVGGCTGAWLGHSISHSLTASFAVLFALLFTILGVLRNAYGELVRALGAAVIFSCQRFPAIRRRYPARYYLWAALTNRREYRPLQRNNTLFVMICLALAGSLIGGSVPLVPTWLGSLVGAALAALSCLKEDSAWGDVSYCVGLRILAVVTTVGSLNNDLELLSKTGSAAGKLTNTLLVWDREHRIQERAAAFVAWVRDRVAAGKTSSAGGDDDDNNTTPNRRQRRRPGPSQQRPPRDGDRFRGAGDDSQPPPRRRPTTGGTSQQQRPPPPPRDPPPPPPPRVTTAAEEAPEKPGFFGLFRRKKEQPERLQEQEEDDLFEGWNFGGTDPVDNNR